jgi:hypothetical protein
MSVHTRGMSKRLQLVLNDEELGEIQRAALRNHMTSSEWVRQVLRKALRTESRSDLKEKLAVVRSAAAHSFPTADIGRILEEIER